MGRDVRNGVSSLSFDGGDTWGGVLLSFPINLFSLLPLPVIQVNQKRIYGYGFYDDDYKDDKDGNVDNNILESQDIEINDKLMKILLFITMS
jgi:hypothetical protein